MKVQLVSHSAQPGGSNETILSLLRHRPPDIGCSCLFLQDGPTLKAVADLGIDASLLDSGRAREVWRAPATVRALATEARRDGADVVFAHVTKAHLYASPAARLAGLPYLWWQHERRSQKPAMHLVSAWLPADAVICSSRWTAAEQRRARRVPVHVIHPGAELEPPPPVHVHRNGEVTIAVVGRLQRWKRVELALQTMKIVLAAQPGARLKVIGATTPGLDDDYGAELRGLAGELKIAGSVDFTGYVPDVGAELEQADVLLHTAQAEPFGLALVEAMAHGIPVVAVAEGGPKEIVRPAIDGLLSPAVPRLLAAAILDLAGDPGRRTQMGTAGRTRALADFSARRMADQTWQLVRDVQRSRA